MFAGKLASFGVINHQNVHVLEGFAKFCRGAFDPIVHGVECDVFWRAFDLLEDASLQVRGDVGEKNMLGVAEYFPDQKKDLPAARSRPAVSILRFLKMAASMAEKSSPTIPTRFTRVKKLAATAKYVAAPPMMRSTFP